MKLLETQDLVKKFGELIAVNKVSFRVEKGEIRGIIGPNGSGKTTLINLISGFYRPTQGTIYFQGERIDGLTPNVISSKGIMRSFQIARVFRDMSVLENMLIPALPREQDRRKIEQYAHELLKFVHLDHLENEPAKNLSGGQSMLLQIVRGFMIHPLHLYMLDEPFAGVHPNIKDTIIETILEMNKEREITFIIVSHEMPTIHRLANCISVLHEGRLISEGSMEEVASDPLVIDAYLGG